MNNKRGFRKPTIKGTSRAYVRLFGYLETPESWLLFLDRYTILNLPFGVRRNGDCAVNVVGPATGNSAILGLEIPNEITYTRVSHAPRYRKERFLP